VLCLFAAFVVVALNKEMVFCFIPDSAAQGRTPNFKSI